MVVDMLLVLFSRITTSSSNASSSFRAKCNDFHSHWLICVDFFSIAGISASSLLSNTLLVLKKIEF